jgi:hypothetical protein
MASRKHQPHRYENRLWKAAQAWALFENVKEICDYILSEHIQPDAPIYYSLVTAICVLYARPFKRSRGIESLSVQFVPKKFRDLHEELIRVRDQTAAHADANAARFHGLPANHVRLIVRDGQIQFAAHRVKFNLTAISRIRELGSALINRTVDHLTKLLEKCPGSLSDNSEYLIDLTTGNFERL